MANYKFRAEAPADVIRLANILGEELWAIEMSRPDPGKPDVEVEIEIGITLQELRQIMGTVPDGHVMRQTVALAAEYTGERDTEL